MSMYLYKKHLVSNPNDKEPEYVIEFIASNEDIAKYKGDLSNTFTTNFRVDAKVVDFSIKIKENYMLELRTEKFIPDLPVYITLTRDDGIDYFLMIKDDILDLEDGYVFASDPIKFLDAIAPTTTEQYDEFKGSKSKIYINFKSYEMTTHYISVPTPDGLSIG